MLLDVSVKMEIIDFLLPIIKQKNVRKYIIITLDCVQPSLLFHENNSWSMLWPGPISPGFGDREHDQRTILEVDVMDKYR